MRRTRLMNVLAIIGGIALFIANPIIGFVVLGMYIFTR